MELQNIRIEDLTEEQLEQLPLDKLQFAMEQMNINQKVDNNKFDMFQVLLQKDINITEVNKED
jgi:hypothetical protein